MRRVFPKTVKIVMTDIVSCRHKYTVGTLRVVAETENTLKVRAYFGSGVVNLFVKLDSEADKLAVLARLAAS